MKQFSSDIDNLTYHSKRLAYLLRHSDLPNHKAWVNVDAVLNELHITLQMLQSIVEEDTKGRFEFSENESSIRALYGHSIDVDLELEPTTPPMILYHGTAEKYVDSIMNEGLKPSKRNFVHLSETTCMAIQIGARHGSPVLLSIDTKAMISSGHQFYKAQNGVWLTGDIPLQFLKVDCYE